MADSGDSCEANVLQIIQVTTATVSMVITVTTQQGEPSSASRKFLDPLKAHTKSTLGRKREVKVNKPAVHKKHTSPNTSSAPKNISPKERLAEYPHEHFKL